MSVLGLGGGGGEVLSGSTSLMGPESETATARMVPNIFRRARNLKL